jgi:hypothetical protein
MTRLRACRLPAAARRPNRSPSQPLLLAGLVLAGPVLAMALAVTGCSPSASRASSGVAQAQLVAGAATRPATSPAQAATGSLVPGFPARLLPLPAGARVTASAVQQHDAESDVSVSATTPMSAKKVLEFYATALGRAGFSRTDGSMLPAGAVGLAFSRDGGRELIVVAVVDRGAVTSFSVGGTVTAGTP